MKLPETKKSSINLISELAMILTIILLIIFLSILIVNTVNFFWPSKLLMVHLENTQYLGEIWEGEINQDDIENFQSSKPGNIHLKIGNSEIYTEDFIWINRLKINNVSYPAEAVTIERYKHGNFYGFINYLQAGGKRIKPEEKEFKETLLHNLENAENREERIKQLRIQLNHLMRPLSQVQSRLKYLKRNREENDIEISDLSQQEMRITVDLENKSIPIIEEIEKLQQIQSKYYLEARDVTLDTVDKIYIFEINQLYFSNKMNIGSKLRLYISKVWNFIFNDPRFANTEGGIFPAILGTVLLVFLMTIMVVPMGVMTALFLCEYTKNNQIIRLIRAAIYNLAGIPSIIFGMFGLGLFIYGIGGSLDQLFFSDHLPQPTFGTGGIFWSALTMALLTLPVVIVASEDGFRVVSREYKEGAYALGANKWQMVSGIMLPRALPAILTGVILAIGRAAGEVAPLMLTGVVKFAQEPLLDNTFPFIHLNAKFMHLGFHIYDLGYQSPNVEAAKPVMFATALLLISIVIVLNLFAFYVRNHYRERYGLSDE